jgi:large subunit ribosomal protein L9
MKVILNADVAKLGKKYEVKNVSDGHALNMLIPKGLVEVATPASLRALEVKKAALQASQKRTEEVIVKNLKTIQSKVFEMTQKVNEKGHLFAAIHLDQVSSLIKSKANVELPSSYLHTAKPIKEVGDHEVTVTVGKESATFNLKIIAE